MLLNPSILALLGSSTIVCGLTIMAAALGVAVAVGWDHRDSGPGQLRRERRWFLIETSLRLILGLQLFSLLLFVATAERLTSFFTGAMCAVGSLLASPYGMPALTVKTLAFILCGLWLISDRASPSAAGTGMIRFKVGFLVALCGALIADNLVQLRYFSSLQPDIITSCCATVFAAGAGGAAAQLARIPVGWSRLAFFTALAATFVVGLRAITCRRPTFAFSVLAVASGLITAAAVVTWIAPAYYELPTHHCPLCLLAPEHGYVGYPFYALLATAVITGAGSGLVRSLRPLDIQGCIRAHAERRLCTVSMASFAAVAAMALWPLVASPFRLEVASFVAAGGAP